jgi:glutathione S-transferase
MQMKLYYHPVSTTSRPILQYIAEHGLELDHQVVDLFTGEHLAETFGAVNPNHQVPVLEDGDFRLTESSAILKYLADKAGSNDYPTDARSRARINERMDWFNTGLTRDLGYGFVYPQLFPSHRRPEERQQAAVLAWGREKARGWLGTLDRDLLGTRQAYLRGDAITIADYFGAAILTLGEAIRLDYSGYPNVQRWLARVKVRPSWQAANGAFYAHLVQPMQSVAFTGLDG